VVTRLHLPVPAGLLALVLLLVALLLRVVPESAVSEGGDLLLKILGALFVPPGIGLVKQFGLLREHGLALVTAALVALFVGQIVAGKVASHWTREPRG
jgi:holin-like protein